MLLLGAIAAHGQQTLPIPVTPLSLTMSFGMVSLSSGQTVRLNAINIVRTPPPVLSIAQFPCKVELDIFDDQGTLLNSKVIDNLGYGKADHADYDRGKNTAVQVTGVVKVGSTQTFFCSIAPTLEVVDDLTTHTVVILGNAFPTPSFQPRPLGWVVPQNTPGP